MNYFNTQNDVQSKLIYGEKIDKDVILEFVIPTYKRDDLLIKAVKSLINQKQPQFIKYHITIVSNDPDFNLSKIGDILDNKLISVYINEKNIGMVGNINRCAILSKAPYVAYLQDDDLLLDEYIIKFEELYATGRLQNIDCLIPNRYSYLDATSGQSVGAKLYKGLNTKNIFKNILTIGKSIPSFQKVTWRDCADTVYNCFSGGPTCGIVFKRESLLSTNGFDYNYPYSFDYVFFIEFSDRFNVVLYNEYLSVYRMTDSASNRPEVQYDFFHSSIYLLNKSLGKIKFVDKYYNEMVLFLFDIRPKQVQKIILENNFKIPTKNRYRYVFFKIIRFIKLMMSGNYRSRKIPNQILRTLSI